MAARKLPAFLWLLWQPNWIVQLVCDLFYFIFFLLIVIFMYANYVEANYAISAQALAMIK